MGLKTAILLMAQFIVVFGTAQEINSIAGKPEDLNQEPAEYQDLRVQPIKKWSLTGYTGVFSTYNPVVNTQRNGLFIPAGVQLNRYLAPNWSAFTSLFAVPAGYSSFGGMFTGSANHMMPMGMSRGINIFQPYMRADVGLRYVNDAKTFSISGSFGIERSAYPMLPIYQLKEWQGHKLR